MSYALESKSEFERLEEQSKFSKYDYKKELAQIKLPENGKILDAGCGSGVVSRYLATLNSKNQVVGVDFSEDRVAECKNHSKEFQNLTFKKEDLTCLSFNENTFDLIICRYVIQHVLTEGRQKAIKELYRVLKPGGKLLLIDFDGAYHNIYPRTGIVDEVLKKMELENKVDLFIGRKLPIFMSESGFKSINWEIETIEGKGKALEEERYLIHERFKNAKPFFSQITGSLEKADEFVKAYEAQLNSDPVVFFTNKFLVTGVKPKKTLKVV